MSRENDNYHVRNVANVAGEGTRNKTSSLDAKMTVSYTPGLELLCRDRLKGRTRAVEHRNGTYILRRPEEVENERLRSTVTSETVGTAG